MFQNLEIRVSGPDSDLPRSPLRDFDSGGPLLLRRTTQSGNRNFRPHPDSLRGRFYHFRRKFNSEKKSEDEPINTFDDCGRIA
jgi:hypothetical protein